MMEMMVAMIGTVISGGIIGLAAYVIGRNAGRREGMDLLVQLRDEVKRLDEYARLGSTLSRSLLETHREEREQLLHHVVSLKKAGFQHAPSAGEEDEGTWVMDDEYEANVSEERRRARLGETEDGVRETHAELIQELGQSMNGGLLRDL